MVAAMTCMMALFGGQQPQNISLPSIEEKFEKEGEQNFYNGDP